MSTSSSSLRRFGWRSAMCTSRCRPVPAAGSTMSISALGAELCIAGAAAVVVSGSLAGGWRAEVLASHAAAPTPPEGRPCSPAKTRSLAASLSQIFSLHHLPRSPDSSARIRAARALPKSCVGVSAWPHKLGDLRLPERRLDLRHGLGFPPLTGWKPVASTCRAPSNARPMRLSCAGRPAQPCQSRSLGQSSDHRAWHCA